MGYWRTGPFENGHVSDMLFCYARQLRAGKTPGQAEKAVRRDRRSAWGLQPDHPHSPDMELGLRLIREGDPGAVAEVAKISRILDESERQEAASAPPR